MDQYLQLLQKILDEGERREDDRTGAGTIGIFGPQLRFDLSKGFPLVTTKKVPFKAVAEELFWFLSGERNIRPLIERKTKIWTSDALRFNLEKVISSGLMTKEEVEKAREEAKKGNFELAKNLLTRYENKILEDEKFAHECASLGPVYGVQWRGLHTDLSADQIKMLEDSLKAGGSSRRMLVSAWNASHLGEMALPPCHYGFQVHVSPETKKLSLLWNQRSVDTILGLPFNIASYALLIHLLAETHGFEVGELIANLGDTHVYLPHLNAAKEQLSRKPMPLCKLKIINKKDSVMDYTWEDIELAGYESHPKLENPTPMFGGFF